MSKPIKVSDQVYLELDTIKEKGETFSQIIEGMLRARLKIFELINVLESQLKYTQYKRDQVDIMTKARLERMDLESRSLTHQKRG